MNHDVTIASTREQALQNLLNAWHFSPETETVPVSDCLDRVAAEDITALYTLPVMRISAMDGFAVKSAAFEDGIPDLSEWVLNKDYTPADTGDDFPDEYDTVIPVEQLHYNSDGILSLEPDFVFQKGSGIRPAGSNMQTGDLVVRKNTWITPELQANLAAGGITEIPVFVRPVIAFIPTGSELIPVGQVPVRGQNIDSNSFLITSYLKEWGADVIACPIVRDCVEDLELTMDAMLQKADIVILNGGSSKGTEDFNSTMLERRGTYFMHTVRTVPGRPVGISIINGKPVINMPGPPMAAWVVGDWLVHPMLCHYYGIPVPARRTVQAVLTEDLRKGPVVELYIRVHLEKRDGRLSAAPLGRNVRTSELLRDGNGLLIAPLGEFGYRKGQPVTVQLMEPEENIPVIGTAAQPVIPANCSQCDNHCPTDALKCGRGKAYLERLRNGEILSCSNEAVNALVDCGSIALNMAKMMKLHDADPSELLNALTAEEQAELLRLLKKQQDRWNIDHAKRHAEGPGGHPHGPHGPGGAGHPPFPG